MPNCFSIIIPEKSCIPSKNAVLDAILIEPSSQMVKKPDPNGYYDRSVMDTFHDIACLHSNPIADGIISKATDAEKLLQQVHLNSQRLTEEAYLVSFYFNRMQLAQEEFYCEHFPSVIGKSKSASMNVPVTSS